MRPDNSHRVLVEEDGDIELVSEYDGEEVHFDTDPESIAWQRAMLESGVSMGPDEG